MIARDFGGIRIHAPTLKQAGFTFNAYPESATVTEDEQEVTNKFLHTVIQYHLGEIILLLAEHHGVAETLFWKIVKKNLIERFHQLKETVQASRWQKTYQAILQQDWQIKSLLRMRLNNLYNKYIYIDLKNPLRDL
jgi:siderophore synthetase component